MPRRGWGKLEVKTWMHSSMKAIDEMVASRLKENADAINKDFCAGELNKKTAGNGAGGASGCRPYCKN